MFDFIKNNDGHVAVTFALLGIPLALAGTLALDNHAAQGEYSRLQAALDGAVLATVSNGTLSTPEDRESYARNRFASNYSSPATLTFTDDGSVVQMTAHTQYDTMLGGIVNKQALDLRAVSAGTLSQGRTVCVLGLAKDGEAVVSFEDSAVFSAINCSVQVNSSDNKALVSTSTMTPQAESFCVNGGAFGKFSPLVNSQCGPVEDPFKDIVLPAPNVCNATDQFIYVEGGIPAADQACKQDCTDPNHNHYCGAIGGHDETDDEDAISNTNTLGSAIDTVAGVAQPLLGVPAEVRAELTGHVTGSNVTIEPGTYCEKLIIDGYNVNFPPGEYHFLQGARFLNGSEVTADNATFIFHGAHSTIEIDTGAQLFMKAPHDGPLSGIAIAQGPHEYARKKKDKDEIQFEKTFGDVESKLEKIDPERARSFLRSGGRLDVVGTVYLPQQHLEVSGNSVFGARAQSTSFIADRVTFRDRMHANIRVDHQAEGLPPVEPRVETSPRLIK